MNRLLDLEDSIAKTKIRSEKLYDKEPEKTVARAKGRVTPISYKVPGIVPAIKQPTSKTCWATVTTMMVCWRDDVSMPIETVLSNIGSKYLNKFKNNEGLASSEKVTFLAAAGLVAEPPHNPSVKGWFDLLRQYGPLWVTTDEQPGEGFAIHARIIKGMSGDGTPTGTLFNIIDPAQGREYNEKVRDFVKKYEEEIAVTGHARIQIVHWPSNVKSHIVNRTSTTKSRMQTITEQSYGRAWGEETVDTSKEVTDGIEIGEVEDVGYTKAMTVPVDDSFCTVNPAESASSPNFKFSEFRCKDTSQTEAPKKLRGNIQEVMNNLEILRSELGDSPITIVSGYRTFEYNRDVIYGGKTKKVLKSRHVCGMAADIKVKDYTPKQVYDTIESLISQGKMKKGGLGLYSTFVHYDVRGYNARW